MLSKITLKNVALIKFLELDFCSGLNILSGETGAGKSILVDGLMLLLGAKYDKSILRYGEKDGFVEGVFECDSKISDSLAEFGFEKDDMLIVVRKFLDSGKNEIRINGRLTTTLVLQKVMARLVDIYGQNEYQSLSQKSMHLKILDAFLGKSIEDKLEKIKAGYFELQSINRALKAIGEAGDRARQVDIIKFSINEITKANVIEGELEELMARRKLMGAGEKIAAALTEAVSVLGDSENNILSQLHAVKKSLLGISGYSDTFESLLERVSSCLIELDDVNDAASSELSGLEFDSIELEKIEKRLEVIRGIVRKYGDVESQKKFVVKHAELLENLEGGEEKYIKLTKQKKQQIAECFYIAKEVSVIRAAGANKFEALIANELKDLGMDGAVFKIEFNEFTAIENFEKFFTQTGADNVEFYFSANKGQPVKPLIKIISGGELSRFMLALKVVSSTIEGIPTMIFDEIDTGISGKIGQEVAKKLGLIARNHQVLCVTHLPQIAAMADNHYFIQKRVEGADTVTIVDLLDAKGEIEEISRLSGASGISTKASDNAAQMKEWSKTFKQNG